MKGGITPNIGFADLLPFFALKLGIGGNYLHLIAEKNCLRTEIVEKMHFWQIITM